MSKDNTSGFDAVTQVVLNKVLREWFQFFVPLTDTSQCLVQSGAASVSDLGLELTTGSGVATVTSNL